MNRKAVSVTAEPPKSLDGDSDNLSWLGGQSVIGEAQISVGSTKWKAIWWSEIHENVADESTKCRTVFMWRILMPNETEQPGLKQEFSDKCKSMFACRKHCHKKDCASKTGLFFLAAYKKFLIA